MDKRRISVYLVIGLLLGSVGIAAAVHLSGTGTVSDGVTYSAPDGMAVNITGETQVQMEQMFPDSQTVALTTEAGNITFSSNGFADATIHKDDIEGQWTNVSEIDADSNDVTIDPEDKPQVTVGKATTAISFQSSVGLSDGTTDFVYSGSGTSEVTLYNVPTNTQLAAVDADTGAFLGAATSDGSGQVTFDSLQSGDHNVELIDKDDATNPTFDNASPVDTVATSPNEISIDVADGDFPHDSVDVAIDFEGTEIHNETITSNTTVTTTNFTADQLGETYSWSVQATDAYGNSDTDNLDFTLPSNLTFRNETRPENIVTGANATVTFYSVDGTTVITRQDTNDDGKISLQGLPDTEFVVTIQADNYYERRVYVESIFEQNTVFLLNSTAYPNAVFTEFELNDRTGNFPSGETTLRVQRALDIDGNNESEWRTVAGDFFGSTNRFPFTGEYQHRYRLVVENGDGDRRVLGSYTPTADGVRQVPIGEVTFSGDLEQGTAFRASLNDQNGHNFVEVKYLDTANTTDELTYNIVRADNESHTVVSNTTITDIEQEYVAIHNMSIQDPSASDDQGYKVNYYADRENATLSGHTYAGGVMDFVFGMDDNVRTLLGWTFIIAFAGITALYNPKMSMLTTPVIGLAFTITGILNIPSVLIALAFVEGGLLYFGETRR